METKKIVFACFVGGVVTFLLMSWLAPALKWLGLIVGFGVGYFTYELRAVFSAIAGAFADLVNAFKTKSAADQVMIIISVIASTPFLYVGYYGFLGSLKRGNGIIPLVVVAVLCLVCVALLSCFVGIIGTHIFQITAVVGAKSVKKQAPVYSKNDFYSLGERVSSAERKVYRHGGISS